MSGVDIAAPAAPVIAAGTPSHPGPSVREGTIAVTEAFGPKAANHVSAAELAAQSRAKALVEAASHPTPGELRPSVRESTIAMTKLYKPKTANHVPPSELPKSQTIVPQVDRPARYSVAPIQIKTSTTTTTTPEGAVSKVPAAATQSAAAAADVVTEAPVATTAEPVAPEVEKLAASPEGALRGADGRLPSVRESIIAATKQHGPKAAHHTPASELPAAEVAIPEAERPAAQHQQQPSLVSRAAATVAAVVRPAPAAEAPVPAVPELIARDIEGRLPSVRESTIAMTQKYGPKMPNHVPPSELSKPVAAVVSNTAVAAERGAVRQVAKAAPATNAPVKGDHRPYAVTIPAAKAVQQRTGSGSLLAKPIREWDSQDIKQAATQVMENKIVMGALAVGAAALTVFSVYKGVEMYNHYRLGQSIAEVEREKPTVVHLYIHRRSPLAPSVSIPCTRIETLLRLARVPYEAHVISDPTVSPNGELPFVVFSGLRIAGAQDITDALARELDVSLDRDLSCEDQATGVALMSAVQYSLTRGYMRAVHVDRPDVMRPYYSEMNRTPDWVTQFALRRMQKRLSDVNNTSGYSQLSSEQYVHELLRDVRAIEALLERHTYLFSSDYPSSYDCALYAWLLPVVAMEDAAEVNEAFAYIVESELLTNFVRRMTELAFPDLDELVCGQQLEEGTEEEREPSSQQQPRQSSLTSEEEHTPTSRERSKSQSSSSSVKRLRMRPSESPRRTSEPPSTVATEEGVGEADLQIRPSQHEVRLPGEA
jgi:hypothetical protein